MYSKEKPIKPISDPEVDNETKEDVSKRTTKRETPGSTAFVPSVAGLIIAGEIINDLTGKS